MKIYCNNCNTNTNHSVVKEETRQEEDEKYEISYFDSWQIIKCLGCDDISFRHTSSNSESYDEDTYENYETVRLYPIRSQGLLNVKPYYNVPPIVRNIYRETIDAFNNGLNLLCAGGLRAIIESICTNENILDGIVEKKLKDGTIKFQRSNNLVGKINGLSEKGFLTKNQAEVLHEHRYLGNDALHSLTVPNKEILSVAIEIIENVLDSLYEISDKAGKLSWRRELREAKKKKQP